MSRRALFTGALLLQLLGVFAMYFPSAVILKTGTPVTLKTVPVDPRSLFRGDYVVLGYEAGQGLPESWEWGTPVYVVLEKKDDVYERVSFEKEKPTLKEGQVCLYGSAQYRQVTFPDIAQYFLEEGLGREVEQLVSAHRLLVDAVVASNCRARIRQMKLGEEVTGWIDPMAEVWMEPTTVPMETEAP